MKEQIGILRLEDARQFLEELGIRSVPIGGRLISRLAHEETGYIPEGSFIPTGIWKSDLSLWIRGKSLSIISVSVHKNWFGGHVSEYFFIADPSDVARVIRESISRSTLRTNLWTADRLEDDLPLTDPERLIPELVARGILRPAMVNDPGQ